MRKVTKIVTFYDDGTFTESTPSIGYTPPNTNTPVFHPPYYPPTHAPATQPWPHYPPYTITCKMEDGSTKTIETGPIYAQGNT